MDQVSSRDRIDLQKTRFNKILQQIKAKEAFSTYDIEDKTNSLLVVQSENGLKIGPVFGNFNPQESYNQSYEEIVCNLALSTNPYDFELDKKLALKDNIQDLAKSSKPLDLEINLKEKPKFNMNSDAVLNPIGFKAKLTKLDVIGNPKVPWQIDSVLEDKLKTTEMLQWFLHYGFDNYYVTRMFSAGLLGIDKRFVSTRQSITATDDLLTKIMLEEIRQNNENQKYLIYENEFLHNKFFVVLMPGKWEYEQYEAWPDPQGNTFPLQVEAHPDSPLKKTWNKPGFSYNHEYEPFYGRTKYAELQAGGYYASRISCVEFLKEKKLQAKVIVFREIYDDYSVPVGVWQVRENVKHSFDNKPKEFQNEQEIKDYLIKYMKSNSNQMISESKILGQKRILSFFN